MITCFEQPLYSKGGAVPQDTLVTQFPITNFSWMEQELKSTWNEIVKMLNVTFEADESIYVHCMAGRHRAPLPAGALLGLLTGENFDSALASIRQVRDIQPEKMFRDRRNAQMIGWLRQACNRGRIVPPAVHLAVEFCRSDTSNSVRHVRAPGAEGAPLQPSCKWRQASQHAKSAFAAQVIVMSDIEAALEQGRKWCQQCVSNLPAGAQGVLRNSLIEFGR